MKPARSCERITCLPSVSDANARRGSAVSGEVSSEGTSSTRGSTGTGLKKWMPMTCSGRRVAMASFMIGIDDVFDASTAPVVRHDLVDPPERLDLERLDLGDGLDHELPVGERVGLPANRIRASARRGPPRSSLPRRTAWRSDASMRARPASTAGLVGLERPRRRARRGRTPRRCPIPSTRSPRPRPCRPRVMSSRQLLPTVVPTALVTTVSRAARPRQQSPGRTVHAICVDVDLASGEQCFRWRP